jgi:4'-phosphopantetheinyl transferase
MAPSLCWLTQNQTDVPDGDDWLGPRELAIQAGFKFPKRRNDWRLGRWTAKCACRASLPESFPDFSRIEILAAEDGGPDAHLAGGGTAPLSVSISHSRDRGFCATAPAGIAVGCDLEQIEDRPLDFFYDYFTPEEIDFCRRATNASRPVACYLVWSAKESALKILREGLRRDTRSIEIRAGFPTEENVWNTWTGRCRETSRAFHGWWRHTDGFVYTLGSDQPGLNLITATI